MRIGRISTNNPVLVNILMVSIFVLGLGSLARLPQEEFAEVPFFFIIIAIPYPGVSAEDVERTVTATVEEEMEGLEMLDNIISTSTDGFSQIQLEFNDGIASDTFERLQQDVRTRFLNIELPDGVGQEIIEDFSSNDFLPVIQVALYGDADYSLLYAAANELSSQLRVVDQVSGITEVGFRERQIVIEADRTQLEARQLDIGTLAQAIQGDNVVIPVGTITGNRREYLLRTVEEVEDWNELGEVIVRSDGAATMRLGDVANIREVYDSDEGFARYNGKPAIILQVIKVPSGSSVGIIESIEPIIAKFEERLPNTIAIDLLQDSTVQIRRSITILTRNAMFGFILVVGILLLFIGVRNAIITAISIPIAFSLTFIVLGMMGQTLNSNTLFALVLVLGLLVDHAIVIVENSYRQQSLGLSREQAAVVGIDQVILPVLAATATTVAAFLPLTFLPGIIGRFLQIVPITVSIALIASTLEAGLFLPSHYADWPGGRLLRGNERLFARFREGFGTLLTLCYRRRGITLMVMLLLMVVVFASVGTLGQDLFTGEDVSYFYIDIEMPVGTSLAKTSRVTGQFERCLLPLIETGEAMAFSSMVGSMTTDNANITRSNVAQITVDLTGIEEDHKRPVSEVIETARAQCPGIAGPDRVTWRKEQTGPPIDPPVVYRIFADSYEDLLSVAASIKMRLADFPVLYNISDNLEQGSPEFRIRVDERLAVRYGLTPQMIGGFLRNSIEGIDAGVIFSDNEEIPIVVRYSDRAIENPWQVQQLKIPTAEGRLVPFSSVAALEQGQSFNTIKRYNRKREVTIEADAVETDDLRLIDREIERFFNEALLPRFPDVEMTVGGQFAEFLNLLSDILVVLSIGVFLIFAIMGAQFKSYLQPILILFSIPFSFIGVFLFLVISQTPVSIVVIYAAVALAGIAVNDSIVLISFINELREAGTPVKEAIIEAAKIRLRPVILTSLTTIGGLAPTAIGIGGSSVVWSPMANTIIFGLLFSTITTLFITPCLYGVCYDRKRSVSAVKARPSP